MSDLYTELIVRRKTPTVDKLKKAGLIVLVVIGVMSMFVFTYGFIVAVAAGLLAYFVIPMFDIEYEYVYVNGEMDIDKIMSKSKRKRIASYDMKKLEVLAPIKSHRLDYYNNNQSIKIADYSSLENNASIYAMIISTDKGLQKVLFEPDDQILKHIKNIAPRKVFME